MTRLEAELFVSILDGYIAAHRNTVIAVTPPEILSSYRERMIETCMKLEMRKSADAKKGPSQVD